MNIRILPLLCCSLFILQGVCGQEEKIRGNKVVVSDYRELEGFHSISIAKNIVALLEEDCQNKIEVEADENLLPIITTTVEDSTLTVTTSKEITSSKALIVRISYTAMLQRIIINDKVELKSKAPIRTDSLWFEAHNNTESFLTLSTDRMQGVCTGKSKVDLHIERGNAQLQIHDNAKFKGLVTVDTLQVEVSLKAKATFEGEVKAATINAKHNTHIYGENLSCDQIVLHAENDSDCYVHANTALNLTANNAAQIYLYGNPGITIGGFTDEAILYKKPSKTAPPEE